MLSVLQILGALTILVPFARSQFSGLPTDSIPYLVPNLVGSAVLAALAAIDGNWGFLLLEGSWGVVAAFGLAKRA